MSTAIFHNFTDKEFIGQWNGRSKKFAPGKQIMMDAYLAEHFAKHLVNKVLIEKGEFTSTSPKKPADVPKFYDLFQKAYIPQEESEDEDESETSTRVLNQRPLSSNIDEQPAKVVNSAPKGEPQLITPNVEDADDEDEFEGAADSAPTVE